MMRFYTSSASTVAFYKQLKPSEASDSLVITKSDSRGESQLGGFGACQQSSRPPCAPEVAASVLLMMCAGRLGTLHFITLALSLGVFSLAGPCVACAHVNKSPYVGGPAAGVSLLPGTGRNHGTPWSFHCDSKFSVSVCHFIRVCFGDRGR